MRTTVTLDPDVHARLRTLARERRISFREALNTALRRGLAGERAAATPVQMPTYDMGTVGPGVDLTKALQLAADLEDAEIIRKLELRK